MKSPAASLFLALSLAGCAGQGRDWPSLNPRPGEISPMVPRAVPGVGRCAREAGADCGPPVAAPPPALADVPAPPTPITAAAAANEVAALETLVAEVEAAAAPRRAAVDAARRAAGNAAGDSAAASRLEAAQSALSAALAPLASADYRRAALAVALGDVPDGKALLPRLEALARRIAALQD